MFMCSLSLLLLYIIFHPHFFHPFILIISKQRYILITNSFAAAFLYSSLMNDLSDLKTLVCQQQDERGIISTGITCCPSTFLFLPVIIMFLQCER